MKIEVKAAENYAETIKKALKEAGISKVIGFSGGADDKLKGIPDDDPLQKQFTSFRDAYHERIISSALGLFRGYNVAILTGGTEGGVPELSTTIAKKFSFFTIGVHPRKGKKYALPDNLVDISITVDPMVGDAVWGDEGSVWTALVDAMIVIGGGGGTLTECAHIQKINESRIKAGDTPKYVIPIYGTGGVAEQLPHLWAKPDIRNASMPMDRVHTGNDAAKRIIEILSLDDYYNPNF